MEFQIKEDKNNLILLKENQEIGYLIYKTDEEGDYIIQSIIIEENYRGKGYAKDLFNKFIEKASKENKKIIPICSYAKKQFEKNKSLEKILKIK